MNTNLGRVNRRNKHNKKEILTPYKFVICIYASKTFFLIKFKHMIDR